MIIRDLIEELELALIAEYMSKGDAAEAAAEAVILEAHIVSDAYASGAIDGKNADIRRRQEITCLALDQDYQRALDRQRELELHAAIAKAERRATETKISMMGSGEATRQWGTTNNELL